MACCEIRSLNLHAPWIISVKEEHPLQFAVKIYWFLYTLLFTCSCVLRADAPIMSQFFEWLIDHDNNSERYDENGRCLGEAEYSLNPPERLKWQIPEKVGFFCTHGICTAICTYSSLFVLCITVRSKLFQSRNIPMVN